MLNMEKKVKLKPASVAEKAEAFFGRGGLGLDQENEGEGCLTFSGGGGFVRVDVCEDDNGTLVTVLTREWEAMVQEFLAKLH